MSTRPLHPAKPAVGRRFFVARSARRRSDGRDWFGPYPSSDIAMVMAEHFTFSAVESGVSHFLGAAFAQRLAHARQYFGSHVARWLEAGMPSRLEPPADERLALIDARILARNGPAVGHYLEQAPGGRVVDLYDVLTRRYLLAVHRYDATQSLDDVRRLIEPVHYALAMRQLARRCGQGEKGFRRYCVDQTGSGGAGSAECVLLTLAEAARMLRFQARFYRGFDMSAPANNFTPPIKGKWEHFCSGAVILPGLDRRELFGVGRELVHAANIGHGIDTADNCVALRWMLLHLSQWYIASERGLL